MTITPIRPIRDLILPLLERGTSLREMLATAIHYHDLEPDAGTIHRALSDLRAMGYVIVHDEEAGRWWLEQPGGTAA